MSAKMMLVVIVGAILIAAMAFQLRREPQPGADEPIAENPAPHEAAIPLGPRHTDATAASTDTQPRNATPDPPAAPLLQASPPAPITEALDELKLPPIPEILETERAFAAEAVDASWAAETEAHILDEIARTTGLKLVTLRVECRTRRCRLHLAQQELSRDHPFPDLVGRVGLKPLWVVATVDRNGVPTSLAYLERQ